MCGFTGIIDRENKKDLENNLQTAVDSIKHRGLDHQDMFLDKEHGVYLAFNRLKIIDLLDRSNQPFQDQDGNIIIMFNGEIYNFLNLKKELEKDYIFKTTSDTEVLLYAYKK